MEKRRYFGLILSGMLLLLATGTSLALGPQPTANWAPASAGPSQGATAPWFVETVDASPGTGSYVSVAINAQGATYISYYNETNESLKMAKYAGTGGNCGTGNHWSCQTVADTVGAATGLYSSIAIDPATGRPAIAYWDYTSSGRELKLATATTSGWDIEKVDEASGRYLSLKIDATGAAHMAYWSFVGQRQELNYARYVGGGAGNCGGNDFQCEVIFDGEYAIGSFPSLALTSSGQPRIAFDDGYHKAIMYGYPSQGAWSSEVVIPCTSCAETSLAIDTAHGNRAHIAVHDEGWGNLVYAGYVGSGGNCGPADSWQCAVIDDVGIQTHVRGVSVAVDKAGYPVIAYHRFAGSPFVATSLNVARPAAALGRRSGNCGPENVWQCDKIQGAGHAGDYLSIAVGPSGLATIAHSNHDRFGSVGVAYQRLQAFLPLALRAH
jgi:hypothetical protein